MTVITLLLSQYMVYTRSLGLFSDADVQTTTYIYFLLCLVLCLLIFLLVCIVPQTEDNNIEPDMGQSWTWVTFLLLNPT